MVMEEIYGSGLSDSLTKLLDLIDTRSGKSCFDREAVFRKMMEDAPEDDNALNLLCKLQEHFRDNEEITQFIEYFKICASSGPFPLMNTFSRYNKVKAFVLPVVMGFPKGSEIPDLDDIIIDSRAIDSAFEETLGSRSFLVRFDDRLYSSADFSAASLEAIRDYVTSVGEYLGDCDVNPESAWENEPDDLYYALKTDSIVVEDFDQRLLSQVNSPDYEIRCRFLLGVITMMNIEDFLNILYRLDYKQYDFLDAIKETIESGLPDTCRVEAGPYLDDLFACNYLALAAASLNSFRWSLGNIINKARANRERISWETITDEMSAISINIQNLSTKQTQDFVFPYTDNKYDEFIKDFVPWLAEKFLGPSIMLSRENTLVIKNSGPDILATNYYDIPLLSGNLFLSFNAGCFRLLVPESHKSLVNAVSDTKEVILTKGTELLLEDNDRIQKAVEILFEDYSQDPCVAYVTRSLLDKLPADTDSGRADLSFSIWTMGLDFRPEKRKVFPARFRTADTLPCLLPWDSSLSRKGKFKDTSSNKSSLRFNGGLVRSIVTIPEHKLSSGGHENAPDETSQKPISRDQLAVDTRKRLNLYLNSVNETYPNIWNRIYACRSSMSGSWPSNVFIPSSETKPIIFPEKTAAALQQDVNLSQIPISVAALAAWQTTKGIYCFEETLALSYLEESFPYSEMIPDGLFDSIPEWSMYVLFPMPVKIDIHEGLTAGFFFHVDMNENGGKYLVITLDNDVTSPGETSAVKSYRQHCIRVPLAEAPLLACVEKGIEKERLKIDSSPDKAEIYKYLAELNPIPGIDSVTDENKNAFFKAIANATCITVSKCLRFVLHLCSANSDVVDSEGTCRKPSRPVPIKTKLGKIYQIPKTSVWHVGFSGIKD